GRWGRRQADEPQLDAAVPRARSAGHIGKPRRARAMPVEVAPVARETAINEAVESGARPAHRAGDVLGWNNAPPGVSIDPEAHVIRKEGDLRVARERVERRRVLGLQLS